MACCKRPLWWFLGSGALFLVGIALVIIAALAKTSLYDTVVGGVYSARYIDNTYETEGCKTVILGDTTCPGSRFKGWSMSSEDKYNTCMRSSAPSSKALSSASRWCKSGSGGCSKPDSCKPGSKYIYSMFSVLNADEILAGYPAEVREMEPISVRKSFDRVHIDTKQWDETGVAQWVEKTQWELIDSSQESLLDQVIVVPNFLAFGSVPIVGTQQYSGVSAVQTSDNLMFMIASAKWYYGLQESLNSVLGSKMGILDMMFSGESAIAWKTFVKDAYRDGSPLVKLGAIFANHDNCKMLMTMVTATGMLAGNSGFFTEMMCTTAYKDNISLSGYSKILEIGKVRVTPDDAMLFHEFDKDCKTLGQKPSFICTPTDLCADKVAAGEFASIAECMQPALSVEITDKLFALFEKIGTLNKSEYMPLVADFFADCSLDEFGSKIEPAELCAKVQMQLQKSGKAAMFSANPVNGDAVAAAYGWTDKAIGATMIPYFVNGTIAQIMNYNGQGLPAEPNSGYTFGVRGWTSIDDPDPSIYTRQQVSSKFGQEGLNFFKSAMGMDHSCAFSYACMSQPSFKLDGKTCVPDDQCVPNYAKGYDVGVVPGRLFDSPKYGTLDFHGVGKEKTLFVSDMFLQANFTQTESNKRWGNIDVDKWNISGVGMRTENCEDVSKIESGIDCLSPIGTINLGYNAGYASGKTPIDVVLPIYSSFPYFSLLTADGVRNELAYDPLDPSKLVKIHPCVSCPAERDFSTYLWTDPQTGMHVRGSQKIQLNYRISGNPANITKFPGAPDTVPLNSSAVPVNMDIMIPVYWIDKYEVAAQYQKDQVESVQTLPSTFNTVFWVSLWIGIVMLAVGVLLLWRGLKLRQIARAELLRNTSKLNLSSAEISRQGTIDTNDEPAIITSTDKENV